MKARIIIDLDMDTGDYELEFTSPSHPGQGINYEILLEALRRVIGDWDKQVGGNLPSVHGKVTRSDN
jgi:hypothetical protein